MEKRTDHLTATYVDLAANVGTVFGLAAGIRVLQHKTPLPVVQRVLIEAGRVGAPLRPRLTCSELSYIRNAGEMSRKQRYEY